MNILSGLDGISMCLRYSILSVMSRKTCLRFLLSARVELITEQEQGVMDLEDVFIYPWQEIHQKNLENCTLWTWWHISLKK